MEESESDRILKILVTEADKWLNNKGFQQQGSLAWWLKEELQLAREYLKGKENESRTIDRPR